MKRFANADLNRDYETYCPLCRTRSPLSRKDMEWLQIYERAGQHPWYRCIPCGKTKMVARMQVRMIRVKAVPV